MKTWELIEQLQGRDPSGEVVLALRGDFKYAANFDLSPPAHRRVILEADAEDIGADTTELEDEVKALRAMVDDLQSALQRITKALDEHREQETGLSFPYDMPELEAAIDDAAEISMREKP